MIKKHGEMMAALLSGVFTLVAWLLQERAEFWAIGLFMAAYVIGGYVKAREGWQTLWQEKELDVNFLMFLAAIGAAWIGHWLEGALLIFIFSLSGALETYTMARSERDLSALMKYKPERARLYKEDGEEQWVLSEELQVGDQVLVKPGERIPADAVVRQGSSAVEQAMVTGESLPIDKEIGDEVYAGTFNGSGVLILEVIRPNEETLLAKIMKRLAEAKEEVPVSQHRIERLERIYAKAVVLVTLLIILLPPALLGWSWGESFYRAMIFLVVASPCALVASIMPALLSALSSGARKGLLFKNGIQLEKMNDVRLVAFDKTGTLTKGTLTVTDIEPFIGTRDSLLQEAASIELGSEHPVAQAIVRQAKKDKLELQPFQRFYARTGWGVEAEYEQVTWRIGKPVMFQQVPANVQERVKTLEEEGKTVVLLSRGDQLRGLLALQDEIRPEAKEAIKQLKKMGIQTAMLTGDQRVTAQTIAEQAGIDLVYSELLPEEKVEQIETLKKNYGQIAMIGDGINDAPALAKAQVGIAMGRQGSDITLETADVVLMNDNLVQIPIAVQMGRRLQQIIKQNIIFALLVIILLITANFAQSMTLPFGVIGHEGSTLLVILNGLRLLR